MSAIFKREFKAYFTSPLGYFVLALTFFFVALFFSLYNLPNMSNYFLGSVELSGMFSGLFTIVLLIVLPVLAMRLFSEEKRQKTDQALLTAPMSLTGIVVGKFLAALLVFAIAISITLVYAVLIAFSVTPDWMVILGNYFGLLLIAGLIISIGLLISTMTESQFVTAIGTFAVAFVMQMTDNLKGMFSSSTVVATIVDFLSVSQRYNNFTVGVINYDDIVFFISLQALFLFLSVRSLDRKRWS